MKHFAINKKRDLLVPDFACYQMDLQGPVSAAIAAGEVSEDFKDLPSWSKFAANPMKSKGFFVRVLEALFKGTGGHDELNVDNLLENWTGDARVAMMFVNAHNAQMAMIDKIANEALDAYRVVTLSGGVKYKGIKVTQKNCQQIVSEVVEQAAKDNKSVLIISNIMGQRSFSIPEITELYLAYDRGEMGATLQKMSRTLTPGEINKTGRIFSLSFDPNRDDKFDSMVIETAVNIKRRKNMKSLAEALRSVLSTIDIFDCTKNGAIALDKDTYLAAALARKAVSRVLGKTINLAQCSNEVLSAIAQGNADYLRNETQARTQSGKTRENVNTKTSSSTTIDKTNAQVIAKAREVVVAILENLDVIIKGTECVILKDAMEIIRSDVEYQDCVAEEFGVGYEVIEYLFDNNIIKQEHAELMYDAA
jgi:methylmalonyl-CoA mutase cobalamin-binding subunit